MSTDAVVRLGNGIRLRQMLRSAINAAVVAIPLVLWGVATLHLQRRTLADAENEMSHVTATVAEHTTRLLEAQALVLDLVDHVAGTRSCGELRQDANLQAFMAAAVHRAAQTETAWVLDADGFLCAASHPSRLDADSRGDRDYFTGVRNIHPGRYFVGPGIIGHIRDVPVFTLSRRRGTGSAFTGIVLAAVNLDDLLRYWREVVAVTPTQRVVLYRTDGVTIARAWEPFVVPRDAAVEQRVQTIWQDTPQGAQIHASTVDGTRRVVAWHIVPGWNVAVVNSVTEDEVLRPWREQALYSGLIAVIASAVLAAFSWQLRRARVRLEQANTGLEERVAERTALLRTFVETMPGVVYAKDRDGRMLIANTGTAALIGKQPAEFLSRTDTEFLDDPVQGAAIMANDRRIMEGGLTEQVEEEVNLPDGTSATWISTKAPLRDETGQVIGLVGVSLDITDRKRAEAILARSQTELELLVVERTRDLERTQQQLAHAQRMEALGQLAGGIAHDFNNVLQSVQGGIALIERRVPEDGDIRRLARMIAESAKRGSSITRRLLAFSRRGELRAEAVDASSLLADIREIFAHTLGAAVALQLRADPGLPLLLADKGQLETVLVNLAINARDAMPNGGTMTLSASLDLVDHEGPPPGPAQAVASTLKPGCYVRLTVSDTGTGMSPEVMERVTEPFFTTKEQGKGTGLGLAMAKGFVEQSGGGLAIGSTFGEGTSVTLWFPVSAEQNAPSSTIEHVTESSVIQGRQRTRILLVDDDTVVRKLTAEQLEVEGFAVMAAESGAAALALLDSGERVDLMVSDLSMPGMDGLAVIREAQKRRTGMPAILLTGFATNAAELAISGALSGTFTLLRKPVMVQQLAERIEILLEGSAGRERV